MYCHVGAFSRFLRERYPEVRTNRFRVFLHDIIPYLHLHMKRMDKKGVVKTPYYFLMELRRFFEEQGRAPLYSEYREMWVNKESEYGVTKIDRLLQTTGFKSFQEVCRFIGYDYYPPANKDYTGRLIKLGFKVVSEDSIEVDGKRYRIDYCLLLEEGNIWLEVDGSSHVTPESKYHQSKRYRGGKTPEESFRKKVKRDTIVNAFFQGNNLPLLRVAHRDFFGYKREDFDKLIEEVRGCGYKRTYSVFKYERKNKIKELLVQGMGTPEIAKIFGVATYQIRLWISQYQLRKEVEKDGLYRRTIDNQGVIRYISIGEV